MCPPGCGVASGPRRLVPRSFPGRGCPGCRVRGVMRGTRPGAGCPGCPGVCLWSGALIAVSVVIATQTAIKARRGVTGWRGLPGLSCPGAVNRRPVRRWRRRGYPEAAARNRIHRQHRYLPQRAPDHGARRHGSGHNATKRTAAEHGGDTPEVEILTRNYVSGVGDALTWNGRDSRTVSLKPGRRAEATLSGDNTPEGD